MRHLFIILIITGFFSGCTENKKDSDHKELIKYVNPLIGTTNGGNTMPGASVPWGMVYFAPQNTRERDWTGSRYFYGENFMYGFGQTHLSGVGCGDFANISIMPTTGKVFGDYHKNRSRYDNEIAEPGYYAVDLTTHNIKMRATASKRTTLSAYTFPEGQGNITIDITEGLSDSRGAYVNIVNNMEIEGWNAAGGFCETNNEYKVYFVARFNRPFQQYGVWENRKLIRGNNQHKVNGEDMGVYVSYDTKENEEILVKVGVSYVSIANARNNLKQEIPGWSLQEVKELAQQSWQNELQKILVEGGAEDEKTIFYTALFHSLIHPNVINDVNGEYPAMKTGEIRKVVNRNQYTVFSLWDTYRTLHPLLTLVYPEVQTDILKTMVDHVENGGELPFWELAADETYVMNGDPAPIVIADSYVKGLQDFDLGKAFEAMKQSALDTVQNRVRPMQKYFSRHGFIPVDDCGPDDRWGKPRMVSECLEYAYSDWAIAQMAKELNRDSLAHYLENRSKAYQYYFNPEIDLLQPRYSNMEWYEPFYPESYKGSWSNLGFVEGNSWQYSFFVPHDIEGLMEKMGGAENYIEQLQKCFDEKNFTIDNEPDIAYPYLFNYVPDEAWRGQKQIAEYRSHEFGNGPGGLPGNDDAGTISAWYVFSALGFYPDCPGKPTYQMGTPVFERAVIRLNPDFYMGEKFEIVSENKNNDNWKIQETKFNGYPYPNTYITHNEITDGGVLTFVFSD